MNPIGIEFISVLGQPPVDYVHVVADLGCRHIGMAPAPICFIPDFYPAWSLVDDAALRRDVKAALRERGLAVSLGEGFLIWPDKDIMEKGAEMDAMAEIGAPMLNAVSVDPDQGRAFDQLGAFAEMAAARGMRSTVEFVVGTPVGDISTAVAAVRHVGRPDFRILVDSMHLFRSGSTAADLAALDPALIGYAQLCDVPLAPRHAGEAQFDRLAPGEGELPLKDMIAALPRDMLLGLELPMRPKAEAGVAPRDYLRPAVEAARDLAAKVARIPAQETPG